MMISSRCEPMKRNDENDAETKYLEKKNILCNLITKENRTINLIIIKKISCKEKIF